MNIDQHPLRYSPLEQAIEAVLFRRALEKKLEGYILETSIEVAQAIIDLISAPTVSSQHSGTET